VRAFVVDAFADKAFRGNPAGVVLLDAPADAVWMQQVAAEFRHSETAFLVPRGPVEYGLRWFTPGVEVALCGHATLASAHVLATVVGGDRFEFATLSGPLTARVSAAGEIELDFPATPAATVAEPPGLAAALGVEPLACSANETDLVVDLRDAEAVANLRPDFGAMGQLPYRLVIVTARGRADVDFVSRAFGGAGVGVGEDPVTGSAHCTLGPMWGQRLGRTELVGAQLSERGGRVGVVVQGDRVLLRGRAVTVLAGELQA
jgi:PhzF family phenazine biosynthesis protein